MSCLSNKKTAATDKEKKWFLGISAFVIAFFFSLSYLFPYTGDDWAWGSQLGLDRLNCFFYDYNGRYLGNLLVILLTRFKILNVIAMTVSYYGACYLCVKYAKNKRLLILVFSVVLFLAMPREMFSQAIVWTSGYTNYVPGALMSLLYIVIIKNVTGKELPEYKKYTVVLTFLLGLLGALFMENVTLFNIALGFAVIVYAKIKFKSFFSAHAGFFIGALAGAAIMFTNGAYLNILKGEDAYRSTADEQISLFETIDAHLLSTVYNLVISNYMMCIIATVLLCLLVYACSKRASKRKRTAVALLLTVNCIATVLIVLRNTVIGTEAEELFEFLKYKISLNVIAWAYILSLAIISYVCIDKEKRLRLMLPLMCVPVAVAPLLVINPIGPRCFFIAYLLMMVYLSALLSYLMSECDLKLSNRGGIITAFVLLVIQCAIYLNIFIPIYMCDVKRNEFAKIQSDNNDSVICICNLPNSHYLWCSSPRIDLWSDRYKAFHGLKEDAKLSIVSEAKLDRIISNYNK